MLTEHPERLYLAPRTFEKLDPRDQSPAGRAYDALIAVFKHGIDLSKSENPDVRKQGADTQKSALEKMAPLYR